MEKHFGWLVVVVALVAAPALGYAGDMSMQKAPVTLSLTSDYTTSPWVAESGWANQAKGKLVFGLKNLLLGWTELVTEPKEAVNSGGNFFMGLGKGLKNALWDELGGVVHTVTFFVPQIDAPLPQGGVFNS